ncbi:MAG: 4Fe-4S binding protein [Deltaproteobacteria bacterium]|nr:4Fe-4S binding protein [Deltaproteobacteria bacterium]MBW2219228.1 4Fe-4S binding protein [Deltaproteobacteria bacterium]
MSGIRQSLDFVNFDQKKCTRCSACVKECPTKAIRIKGKKHIYMVDRCIGCGECIRVCRIGAVSPNTLEPQLADKNKTHIAIVSPVLYGQFLNTMPEDVLMGLRKMGFHHIVDPSYYIEMLQLATEEFVERNRQSKKIPWPVISPLCPVTIRLIAFRFPGLLQHILPLKRSIPLAAERIKEKYANASESSERQSILYHITPCAAGNISSYALSVQEPESVDQILGINEIFSMLLGCIKEIDESDKDQLSTDDLYYPPNRRSLMWGLPDGEIAGMRIEKSMAVSGLKETISYLEKIEVGLLKDVEYIEFRTCPEGCLGGPLTAVDKYMAKAAIHRMIKFIGKGRTMTRKKILKRYENGYFFSEINLEKLAELFATSKKPLSIESMQEVERLLKKIKGRDCAACGVPDCRTFAEEVVSGEASSDDCVLLKAYEIVERQKAGL